MKADVSDGCWLLAACWWVLAAAVCWLIAHGCWVLDVDCCCCLSLAEDCWLLVAGCWLLDVCCWMVAGCYLLADTGRKRGAGSGGGKDNVWGVWGEWLGGGGVCWLLSLEVSYCGREAVGG